MATSGPSGYVPSVHHPEVMRSILAGIVETGDVIGTVGPGRTIGGRVGVAPASVEMTPLG